MWLLLRMYDVSVPTHVVGHSQEGGCRPQRGDAAIGRRCCHGVAGD